LCFARRNFCFYLQRRASWLKNSFPKSSQVYASQLLHHVESRKKNSGR
jgi:hypothetical protein